MKATKIIFPCGNLKLEGVFFAPELASFPAVVVTHPHPHFGGSLRNNVVLAIADALTGKDIAALLFNFRGVGGSEGVHGAGLEEQKDIRAALNWLMKQPGVNIRKMGLAGYSFGGGVALPVGSEDPRVKGMALISPFFESSPSSLFRNCTKPMLILGGSKDLQVSTAKVIAYGKEAGEAATAKIMEGTDHFWAGYEQEMGQAVADFFSELFK